MVHLCKLKIVGLKIDKAASKSSNKGKTRKMMSFDEAFERLALLLLRPGNRNTFFRNIVEL